MRVAVLGAGYAGVISAHKLADRLPTDVELIVVDQHGEHLVQHEVHRVLRRPALANVISIPLGDLLDRPEIVIGRVTGVDPEAGVVILADGGRLTYDFGVVALGAVPAFYDLPGVEQHATPLKSIDHAKTIRRRFLEVCDLAPTAPNTIVGARADGNEPDPDGRGPHPSHTDNGMGDPPATDVPRVVIGGAGLSGIQVAGELSALARERGVDVEVFLLERARTVAPTFPENFQTAVATELLDRGVTVRTGATVQKATSEWIHTDEGEIAYDQFVWTGGITGAAVLGCKRPTVGHTLRLTDRTFFAGDAAHIVDSNGKAVPDSAQTAVRQAQVVAENVAKLVTYEQTGGLFEPRLRSYTYDEVGWLVSVGDGAVAQIGPSVVRGRAAKALKTSVGAGYLSSIGAMRAAVDMVNQAVGIADDVNDDPPEDTGGV